MALTDYRPRGTNRAKQSRTSDGSSAQAAVVELGQTALTEHNTDDLFERALFLVSSVLDVEFAKILEQRVLGDPLLLRAGRGWNDPIRVGETLIPVGHDSQAGYTLLGKEPVIVEDLSMDLRFSGPPLLTDHHIVSGMSVIIPGAEHPYGILAVHTTAHRTFTQSDSNFLRSVANIIGSAVRHGANQTRMKQHAEAREQRLHYETALAHCAQALLTSHGEDRLLNAVQALLSATQATYVFVERNEVDPEFGLCSRTILEVEDGSSVENDYWDLVPWTNMPTSRAHLEAGKPFLLIPAELEGPEFVQYANDPYPIESELDIPIFCNGEWSGLIGFADSDIRRTWTDEDISLLTTAATMIGAFWERDAQSERLEELIHAKDVFLASVSHELRTPLTAVVGFGQVLRDNADYLSATERSEILDMVINQSTDVTNIVNDLLVAAKADIGTLEVAAAPVNLCVQANQVLETFSAHDIDLTNVNEAAIRTIGDPDRIRQVIRNLITNAVRYGGPTIRLEVSSDTVSRIRVCDDGEPILDTDRERIFQAYQRAHNAPGIAGSLGLGLAISRQLARLMGGDLTYSHEQGESIFELTLPIPAAEAPGSEGLPRAESDCSAGV